MGEEEEGCGVRVRGGGKGRRIFDGADDPRRWRGGSPEMEEEGCSWGGEEEEGRSVEGMIGGDGGAAIRRRRRRWQRPKAAATAAAAGGWQHVDN